MMRNDRKHLYPIFPNLNCLKYQSFFLPNELFSVPICISLKMVKLISKIFIFVLHINATVTDLTFFDSILIPDLICRLPRRPSNMTLETLNVNLIKDTTTFQCGKKITEKSITSTLVLALNLIRMLNESM